MALSDLFSLRRRPDTEEGAGSDVPAQPTKALGKFLSSLQSRSQPVLLDLGPVVGSNVTFFGEQLGCKIFVENLFKDVDRHVQEGRLEDLPAWFDQRFSKPDASVDGILSWDLFDYLDKRTGSVVARHLVRLLKPEGALFAMFNASEPRDTDESHYTRFVVVDPTSLQYRPYRALQSRGRVLQNRDITRMFEPLRITDQFLLKSNIREVLFRKASVPAGASPATTA
ncbi:MAG: class I SAM-dependent methyltransferase [Vicinamibacterales bacterium]